MAAAEDFTFITADLRDPHDLTAFRALNDAYFDWMDGELARVTGKGLQDIVGMDRARYVDLTVEVALAAVPHTAQVYFLRDGAGRVVAMGGLRVLPDGAPEIVRIFTLPEFRGRGLGARMVNQLVAEAEAAGHAVVRLDTGVFMRSAQKIYEAAGFKRREPYPGAEPPEFLQPFWIYMERAIA
jgi:GNAT superfamily N-acetyltransferase